MAPRLARFCEKISVYTVLRPDSPESSQSRRGEEAVDVDALIEDFSHSLDGFRALNPARTEPRFQPVDSRPGISSDQQHGYVPVSTRQFTPEACSAAVWMSERSPL